MKVTIIGKHGHYSDAVQSAKRSKDIFLCAIAPGVQDEDMSDVYCLIEDELGQSPEMFGSWEAMIEKTKPDVCVVNTEYYMNGPISASLLRRGVHVYAEKPGATSLEQLDELIAAYRSGKASYLSMLNYYYSPEYQKAYEIIESGAIGKVRLISAQKSYKLGERPAFYSDIDRYGGTIPWVGVHPVQWAYQMSGKAGFISAYAISDNSYNKGNGTMDMTAIMSFKMAGDVLCTANLDYLRPGCASSHGDDRLRVAGTEGVLEITGGEVQIISPGYSGVVDVAGTEAGMFDAYVGMLSGSPARFDAEDCFVIARAALCAQQSAATGMIVDVAS